MTASNELSSIWWHDIPISALRLSGPSVEIDVLAYDEDLQTARPLSLTVTEAEAIEFFLPHPVTGAALEHLEVTSFDYVIRRSGTDGVIGIIPGNSGALWRIEFRRAVVRLTPRVDQASEIRSA
ncbi:hypothetical protein [Herbiconiux sp. YIM B11900]|uniref:hypothetical protein n=1 Tax=Herbiconiux sp. YIM B11900 TaxID=3404131 RepID=UPI003F86E228